MNSILVLILAGAVGALVKDILEDGRISLPKKVNSDLILGFIGSMIVGAFIGFVVDNNPVTAGLAGYVGKAILEKLVSKNSYH